MRAIRTATVLLALLPLSLCTAAWAVDGFVVNEKQEPIVGARVCYFVDNVEVICSLTDENGRYELPVSETDTIRAHAEGYNPKTFSGAGQQGSVTLELAPVLMAWLIDAASGERIEKGEVVIIYPSGKQLGPFPTKKAGMRVARGLQTGEIRVIGKAEGFLDSDPVEVTLEAGEQSDVALELVADKTQKPE